MEEEAGSRPIEGRSKTAECCRHDDADSGRARQSPATLLRHRRSQPNDLLRRYEDRAQPPRRPRGQSQLVRHVVRRPSMARGSSDRSASVRASCARYRRRCRRESACRAYRHAGAAPRAASNRVQGRTSRVLRRAACSDNRLTMRLSSRGVNEREGTHLELPPTEDEALILFCNAQFLLQGPVERGNGRFALDPENVLQTQSRKSRAGDIARIVNPL